MFTEPAAALPLKKRALQGRRLVVVDIENVAGGAVVTDWIARWARMVVETALDIRDDEQVVIGTSHVGLFHAKAAWPCARVKVRRSGENVAGHELIEVLTSERIEERFDEVVLVSGNQILSDAVASLGGSGVSITVVSWAASLSRRLRMAAARNLCLDELAGHLVFREAS